ncbi:MAG: PSP1 domain-containing protein [Thermodesulfobacteriota bacterium]
MNRTVYVKIINEKVEKLDAGELSLDPGDFVIVESEKGCALGKVLFFSQEEREEASHSPMKKVLRKATSEHLEQFEKNQALEKEAFQFCLQKVREKNLNMKLVKAELLLDRSRIIFYFTAEKRVDFRELVRELASKFRMRIEMRQIGVRDEAKMICGIGSCGLELCCSKFMHQFELVSVKMVKEQNLALNPNKLSGLCGRLMCCLAYEYATYMELKKGLPKVGKQVHTRFGKGKVVRQNVLNQTLTIELEEGGEITIHASEI